MGRFKKSILRRKRRGGAGRRRLRTRGSVKKLTRSERKRRRQRLKKKTTHRKRCPNGTRRNKKTRLCEPKTVRSKKKTVRSKTKTVRSKKKTVRSKTKTATKKPATKKAKKKTVRSKTKTATKKPATKKAKKKTVRSKKKATKVARKPTILQRLGLTKAVSETPTSESSWDYSPTINKVLPSLKTLSPDAQIFDCDVEEIAILHGKGRKCVSWKSKEAQTAMLRNLNSKKPIVCSQIIAPKQLRSNCWFNTFFMCCFISDKGRKFFRFLRQTMITGVLPNGKSVPENMKWPLFLMNKYIDASLRGEDDATRHAWLMDTNLIIKNINRSLTKEQIIQYEIPKVGDAGNPLLFYAGLFHILTGVPPDSRKSIMTIQEFTNGTTSQIEKRLTSWFRQGLPNVIAWELEDDYSKLESVHRPLELNFRHKGKHIKYVLDSAMLRDVSKHHFTAYITCNGEDYSFDGASFSRLEPFSWREKLNKNETWIFKVRTKNIRLTFNFMSGLQTLLYYRVH